MSAQEISVRSEMSGYSHPWGNFVGYRKLEPGFLVYHDKRAFFIPAVAMTAASAKRIEKILEVADLPKL